MTKTDSEAESRRERTRGGSSRVAAGILLSRLAGLARERAIAYFFGTSLYADAWRAALRIPNVLQNLLGEGTLSASFIPVYAEMVEQGRHQDARRFAGAAVGILAVVAGLAALLGIALAPLLVTTFFAGFEPEQQALTVTLMRILFPMTAVLVLSAWALGILNSHRRFFLSYSAPVLWNVTMITVLVAAGTVWAFPQLDLVTALAWAALAGGGAQLAVQLPSVLRLVGAVRPSLDLNTPGIREAIRNFGPVVAGRGVVNLSAWLDVALAALLTTGAVAILGYAQTLYLLPIALFGMAVAASELPELSREREADRAKVARHVSEALERVTYFVLPATLAYLALGDQVVGGLYRTGEFGAQDTMLVHVVLAAYALGMPASSGARVLSSAYFALRDTKTPARMAILRVGVSLVVGASLMFPVGWMLDDLRFGAAGLGLGASVGAWLEYGLLRRRLSTYVGPHAPSREHLLKVGAAAVLAVAAGLLAKALLPEELHPVLLAAGTLLPAGVLFLAFARGFGLAFPMDVFRSTSEGRGAGGEGDRS